jgi:hypothetical protein
LTFHQRPLRNNFLPIGTIATQSILGTPSHNTKAMANYSQLKVPDLKKILAERGIVQPGNKADLIARLQEEDNKKSSGAASELICLPHDWPCSSI